MSERRADALRNRQALLDAATALFVEQGPDVALGEVARAAGVSIATLYRNFATREDLVAATYRREIAHLTDTRSVLDGVDGATAMAAWIDRMVEYSHTKRAIARILHDLPPTAKPPAREAIITTIGAILTAGVADGTLRADVDADDVLALLGALWTLPADDRATARARRLGGFVAAGLRADGDPRTTR